MTPAPDDARRISLLAAQYLQALERDDQAALDALWQQAATDPGLLAAFEEIHDGLIEEADQACMTHQAERVAQAAEHHLPSGEIVRDPARLLTVAAVAEELFRHPPSGLSSSAQALNDRLRQDPTPLPEDLGWDALTAWAQARFGPASPEYWRAFWKAAVKLELRHSATRELLLAARRAPATAPPPTNPPPTEQTP